MKGKRYLSLFLMLGCVFLTGFKQHTPKLSAVSKNRAEDTEKTQKKLDLSVPKSEISFQGAPELLATAQTALSGIEIKKRKNRDLDLQGKVIMSQEPEAGKTRSADGAGIVINFHH
jgi:hypothetical protein